jgi:hypothetical protein
MEFNLSLTVILRTLDLKGNKNMFLEAVQHICTHFYSWNRFFESRHIFYTFEFSFVRRIFLIKIYENNVTEGQGDTNSASPPPPKKNETISSFPLLVLPQNWNGYIVLVTNIKLEVTSYLFWAKKDGWL